MIGTCPTVLRIQFHTCCVAMPSKPHSCALPHPRQWLAGEVMWCSSLPSCRTPRMSSWATQTDFVACCSTSIPTLPSLPSTAAFPLGHEWCTPSRCRCVGAACWKTYVEIKNETTTLLVFRMVGSNTPCYRTLRMWTACMHGFLLPHQHRPRNSTKDSRTPWVAPRPIPRPLLAASPARSGIPWWLVTLRVGIPATDGWCLKSVTQATALRKTVSHRCSSSMSRYDTC